MSTAAEAHAIETREPTVSEIAETNVLQDAGTKAADTIQTRAADAFLSAYDSGDKAWHKAILSLSLILCAEQVREVLTDGNYDANRDGYVFRKNVLFPAAAAGRMIYRETDDAAAEIVAANAAIKAARGANRDAATAERDALVASYVKAKGLKFVRSVATVRAYGFKLAAWMRDNAKSTIVECARASSPESAEIIWSAKVAERFGTTFARLSSELDKITKATKPAKSKPEAAEGAEGATMSEAEAAASAKASEGLDPIAGIMAKVEGLSDEQFASLMFRLKAEAEARGMIRTEAAPSQTEAAPLRLAA